MMFFLVISFMLFFYSSSLAHMLLYMMVMSFSILITFWYITGSSWVSLIFIMLFLGGILVVFMSISSIFPNFKMRFMKFEQKSLIILSFFFFLLESNFIFINDFKWLMVSSSNFFCYIFLVMVFFFCFLYMVSKDKSTLRMFL